MIIIKEVILMNKIKMVTSKNNFEFRALDDNYNSRENGTIKSVFDHPNISDKVLVKNTKNYNGHYVVLARNQFKIENGKLSNRVEWVLEELDV